MLPDFPLPTPDLAIHNAENHLVWLELVPPPDSWREVEQLKAELEVLRGKWFTLQMNRLSADEWYRRRRMLVDDADRLSLKMYRLWLRGIA